MKIIEDKVYMQFYWDLASEVEGNRTNAAYQLVKYVQNLEQVRKIKDNESKYQTQKEYIDYSLKRLIRGMGSPRDHARQGFAIAFCELIRVFNVDSKTCITLMDENLQVCLLSFTLILFHPYCLGNWRIKRIRRTRYYVW